MPCDSSGTDSGCALRGEGAGRPSGAASGEAADCPGGQRFIAGSRTCNPGHPDGEAWS